MTSTPDATTTTGQKVLTGAECREKLAATPIGRIGFIHDGMPMVMPVNFRWHNDTIVFRSQDDQKLSDSQDRAVCFEVDEWSSSDRTGWSVIVRGVASEVTDWADKELLEQIGLLPWTTDKWRQRWVRVEPIEITGREITRNG